MKGKALETIAIPCFGTRISPRFDCAQRILIVTVIDGEVVEQREFLTGDLSPLEKVKALATLGVKIVVCGGIDQQMLHYCRKKRLKVYAWLNGEIKDILADMLRSGNSVSAPSAFTLGQKRRRNYGKKNTRGKRARA